MRSSDIERLEALARGVPRRRRRRGRGSIVASITSALLIVATLALAEDAPQEDTQTPTTEPTPSPEAAPSTDPSPAPSPEPEPTSEPEPNPETGSAVDPTSPPEASPSAAAPSSPPTIASDQADYPPGGTVTLTGTNWQPGEVVHIRVNDDAGETWRRDVDVVADANGVIIDVFELPDWFVATYTVTATGPVSGTATTTFTDSNVRFLTNVGGPTLTGIAWQLYSDSQCTTALTGGGTSGSGTISPVDGATTTLNVALADGQFVGLTVPLIASGQGFVNWTRTSGNAAFATLAPGNRKICVTGENNNSLTRFTANYIANVNDAPAGTDTTVSTSEDTAYVFTAADFGFTDPNDTPANNFDSVKITTLPTDGTLKLDGVNVTTGQFVSKADIDAGKLTFHPDANENASPYATFTFQVKDDGGTLNGGVDTDQSANTMTINVTAVNDPPVIDEDNTKFAASMVSCPMAATSNAALKVVFSDVDLNNPADTHTVSIDWGDGTSTLITNAVSGLTEPHTYSTAGTTYIATIVVQDAAGASDTYIGPQITVNYSTSGILQPVNWTQAHNDPSVFKHGSTIPVKVQFFNCDGTNAGGLSVKIEVKKLSGSTPPSGDNEVITNTNSPDSGGFMRWSSPLYIYNLNTKSLSDATATYEITLTVVSTGQKVFTQFGTRAK